VKFLKVILWLVIWNLALQLVNYFVDDKIFAMGLFGLIAMIAGDVIL